MVTPIHERIIKAVNGLPIPPEILPEILKQLQSAVDWGYERGQTCHNDDHLKVCLMHRLDACFCNDVGQLPECARCVAIQELMKVLDHQTIKR